MISTKDILGKPLITATSGRKVGEVKDLYLDADASQIHAVLAGQEGLLNRRSHVVRRDAIQVYGPDAWLVRDSDGLVETHEEIPPDWLAVSDLRGREVVTEGGTWIGTVGDVLLDTEGRVDGLMLGKVHVHGPLADNKHIPKEAILRLDDGNRHITIDLARAEAAALAAKAMEQPELEPEPEPEAERKQPAEAEVT